MRRLIIIAALLSAAWLWHSPAARQQLSQTLATLGTDVVESTQNQIASHLNDTVHQRRHQIDAVGNQ